MYIQASTLKNHDVHQEPGTRCSLYLLQAGLLSVPTVLQKDAVSIWAMEGNSSERVEDFKINIQPVKICKQNLVISSGKTVFYQNMCLYTEYRSFTTFNILKLKSR